MPAEVVRAELAIDSRPLGAGVFLPLSRVDLVLLRLTDSDGATGTAYLWCFGRGPAGVLAETLRWLAPLTLHALPDEMPILLASLRAKINFLGLKGAAVFALSAVDMAMTDLRCRREGVSLSEFLGIRRDRVPTYWSGFVHDSTDEELREEADLVAAKGFRAFKFRIGTGSLAEDERRLQLVLERFSDPCTVMFDANQRFSVEAAIEASRYFADRGIHWFEDALVHNDYPGLARLVAESPIPIATGENEYLREGFEQLFAAGPAFLLADLERVGGITEWLAVAERSAEQGAVLTSHAYPHVSAHLCAALDQEEVWCEYMPWFDDLFAYDLELVDGELVVPDVLGCGMELREPKRWERVAGWQS